MTGVQTCALPISQASRPQLVRGDCAYGSEGEMSALEAIGQPYLFKLRQSVGVKKLVQRLWTRRDWRSVGQVRISAIVADRFRLIVAGVSA